MSDVFYGQLSPPPTEENWMARGYTIRYLHECRVVFGLVPADDVMMLAHGYGRKALMAMDLAARFGATYVIGTEKQLAALRAAKLPPNERWQAEASAARAAGLPALSEWLLDGNRGRSAEAIATQLFGIPAAANKNHPHDSADLVRCLQLLDCTGTPDRIDRMRDVSPEWAALVANWPELVAFARNGIESGRTNQTDALLTRILDSVRN